MRALRRSSGWTPFGAAPRRERRWDTSRNEPISLYRWMTGGALLQHAAAYYPAWDHDYAARLCLAFDLQPQRRIGTFSKGESRRLQLVLALAHHPPVLLLDEPTDGLDPLVRSRMLSLLAEHMADTPTTVLVSTHQIHEFESLADYVGVLRRGRLQAQLSRDELRRTVDIYLVEVPAGWQTPQDFQAAGARISGRHEAQWTLVGDQRELILIGSRSPGRWSATSSRCRSRTPRSHSSPRR